MYNRVVGSKKRLSSNTAILNPNTSNLSRESEEGWWNEIDKSSNVNKTVLDSPVLSYGTMSNVNEIGSFLTESWDPQLLVGSDTEPNNSAHIKGNLSAEIAKGIILETTSESEKEADIKKTKVPLRLVGRKSTDNNFLRILQNPGHVSLHETDRIVDNSLKNRSKKYLPEKLQEKKEDSEDSMPNIPLKPRVRLLRKREANDVFQKKLVDEVNSSDDYTQTGSKHLRKSHIDDLNLSRASPKPHLTKIKKHFINNRESSEHDRIPLEKKTTLKTQILQHTHEGNVFEAAFADNSDANLPKGRDLTLDMDTQYSTRESQVPRISSSLSPEIPVADSANDIYNQLKITNPRSKFFKALKRSSKETQDKILQDIAKSSSVSHNIFDERSIILKPKTRINRVLHTSSTGNPFEEVFQEHNDKSGENDSSMSIRNFTSPELDVAMGTISPVAFSAARNSQSSMNERLKKLSSLSKDIPSRRRSSSLNEEQGENISNELYEHLEEQHPEVPNAVDILRSGDNRTVLIEKAFAPKFMSVEKIAQISKDNIAASKTPVGVMDTHKSGLLETDDSSEADTNTKYRLHGQDARKTTKLTRSNSRSKSATPKIVSDILKKLPRRSARLNQIEHSDNSILEPEVETRNTPRTRKSTRNSKNISVSERESTVISSKLRGWEDVAADKMKDATTLLQTNQQKSPSQSDRTGDKTFRRTSTRMSTLQDASKSNVKDNKITSLRQSGLIQSHSDSNSSIRASTKDISKDKVSANKTHPVIRMDTDKSLPLETRILLTYNNHLIDDLPAVTTEKSNRSTSIIGVTEQGVHKKPHLSRSISTSKIASDLGVESLRRSERLNNSIEHSNSPILNSETRNTSQMRGNISKTSTRNRTIRDFFKVKPGPLSSKNHSTSNHPHSMPLEIFKDAKKMQQFKEQVETMKSREITAMRMRANKTDKKQSVPKVKVAVVNMRGVMKKKKLSAAPVKKVNPAYLVNGKVYKAPKLLRPKQWATNRLYKFLWKHIEPKYKLATRVRSEKFVEELSKTVTMILRRKKYNNYKNELQALMKEMARLQLINTRNDFYNFCRDFMPYEFRVKVIPILLPGNQQTIPYEPEKLHTPLLDE